MIGIKHCVIENGSPTRIKARYDGRDYVFEPSAPGASAVVTPLSEEAARHIFGYGEKDKTKALLRLGWLPNGMQLEMALEKLDAVQFLAVQEPVFVEEPPTQMPRKVSAGEPQGRDLSHDEKELARKLVHQDGPQKQFGKP